MPTTTTIGSARDAIVAALNTGELQDKMYYAWPGPQLASGQHEAAWIGQIPQWTQEIPNLKAGRKQRQERYVFELVIWVARPDLSSTGAKATFDRALELLAVAENALADDVQLNETDVQWMTGTEREIESAPLEKGWGTMILTRIEGNARLT